MLFRKSTVALLAAVLMLSQATLAPRQSKAVVAAVTGGAAVPALIVLGAGAAVTGLGVALLSSLGPGFGDACDNDGCALEVMAPAGLGLLGVLVGIILLDDSGAPTPDFQAISSDEAQAAQIAPAEAKAFNRSLERINAVSESIAREIADHKIRTTREALELANAEWDKVHDDGLIGDLAYAALTKRGALAIRKAQQAR